MLFQFGGHGIVPAIEVTEQGYRCDQFDNLAFIKMFAQFIEIFLRRLVGNEAPGIFVKESV